MSCFGLRAESLRSSRQTKIGFGADPASTSASTAENVGLDTFEQNATIDLDCPERQQLTCPNWTTCFEPVLPHDASSGWGGAHLFEVQKIGNRIRIEGPWQAAESYAVAASESARPLLLCSTNAAWRSADSSGDSG
jgi:hypothetical protein